MENSNTTEKNQMKKLKSIIGVIFLGALGSGFWELFLKDITFKTLNVMLSTSSKLFSSLPDYLYQDIGKGETSILLYVWPMFFILVIISYPWFLLYKINKIEKNPPVDLRRVMVKADLKTTIKLPMKSIYFVLCLMISILDGKVLITQLYNFKTTVYIEQSLEIIRPYINENRYILLRSEYRQISTRDQFQHFYSEIKEISNTNKVELPSFSPLLLK